MPLSLIVLAIVHLHFLRISSEAPMGVGGLKGACPPPKLGGVDGILLHGDPLLPHDEPLLLLHGHGQLFHHGDLLGHVPRGDSVLGGGEDSNGGGVGDDVLLLVVLPLKLLARLHFLTEFINDYDLREILG